MPVKLPLSLKSWFQGFAIVALALAVSVPMAGQATKPKAKPRPARHYSAKQYFSMGEQAMKAKNYDQAYADYRQALEAKPDNVDYQLATHRAQFAAANDHIQRGEKFKSLKQYPEAASEFQHAAEIDPANFIAGQELQAVSDLMHPQVSASGEPVTPEDENALQRRLDRAGGPVELGNVANTLIKDFTVNSDPKNAYLAAGKLAGINILFDSSSSGGYNNQGHVSLSLHNVTLLQILRILNVQTNSFWVPITSNTILVANDNQQNHSAVDQTVLKVFYIKNVQAPTDLQELAQAIRGLMQPQPKLMPVASINALVMRDTPDKVAMVQRLLDQLDKAQPEVVVDVRILQVNRSVARDLGLLPPTSIGIGLIAPTTTTTTGTGTTTGAGTTTPAAGTNSPTLNELKDLNSHNFSVTIPNATLNALLANSNTQTIQEPQLRSIQGQKASLKIGERIPTATGSFQPGIGGVGINPLVNTQFTYQDIGVNIEMTPQIHGDDSILLKEHINISNVAGQANIGGIQQPIIGNNDIEHTISLKNGESAVMGGLMVNTVTHTNTGIPGLNAIPLFKFLFSTSHDETVHSEILVVLTPHIVRSLHLSPTDLQALDTGTANDVHLRELPPASPATETETPAPTVAPVAKPPATAAARPNPASSTPAAPVTPAGNSAALSASASAPAALVFGPPTISAQAGKPFTLTLDWDNAKNAYALTFQLNYDPKVMQVTSMALGDFLSRDGQAPALVHREDAANGTAQVSLSRPPSVAGVAGSGHVVSITFTAKAPGTSPVTITRLGARGPNGALEPLQAASATVVVH